MDKQMPRRKPTRLCGFDYNKVGAYFITICTKDRACILSRVVGVDVLGDPSAVELLPCGMVANKYIAQIDGVYANIHIEKYVIMPNHIHMLICVSENGSPRTSTPTKQTAVIPNFVSTLKRFCNKECGESIWQRGFHDHIIRNRKDYEEHLRYIYENPMRWHFDELYSDVDFSTDSK